MIGRESAELAGYVTAEALGLPLAVAQNDNLAVALRPLRRRMREQLDALCAAQGAPPAPDLALPYRYLLLLPVPHSSHDPSLPLPLPRRR